MPQKLENVYELNFLTVLTTVTAHHAGAIGAQRVVSNVNNFRWEKLLQSEISSHKDQGLSVLTVAAVDKYYLTDLTLDVVRLLHYVTLRAHVLN